MTNQGAIFLLQEGQKLVPMREEAYDSEDLLQRLLANYPDLLAGEQMDRVAPRKWVLVKREAGVPARQAGGDQWSMDHLFLDQDGIPTIVEVKRSTDTRIRREVVGQMLDYAANAVVYWPAERIRMMFEETCRLAGITVDEAITELTSDRSREVDSPVEQFWQDVERNLQARKVRMVFVADAIPPELQRIVEFLNGQMTPAEVLAVEVRQYVGEGAKTLVPRVFGLTAAAVDQKGHSPTSFWDRERFLDLLSTKHGNQAREVAEKIISWCEHHEMPIGWGRGSVDGSCLPAFQAENRRITPFVYWTYGRVQVQFGALLKVQPFDQRQVR